MTNPIYSLEGTCLNCGVEYGGNDSRCPSCMFDLGAPNVREANETGETNALKKRMKQASNVAKSNSVGNEFRLFHEDIKKNSFVTITVPAVIAATMAKPEGSMFANYEKLVASGSREPANVKFDRERCTIGGTFFGSYADEIRYGVLAINNNGLPTYGDVVFSLMPKAIKHRVSFLEENTYQLEIKRNIKPRTTIPKGYRATWDGRADLAVVKQGHRLKKGMQRKARRGLLISCDGKHRQNDDFIEAHIFGGFNLKAIREMSLVGTGATTPDDEVLAKIAISQFQAKQA